MDNTLIIYCSKTGFSQRYALWLAEEPGCRALPYRERASADLGSCDTLILAGGLYAGRMAGLGWLKKRLPELSGKRVAALAVGCSPADYPGLSESMEKLFGDMPQVQGFYCQGGLDYEHMGAVDRAMMAGLRAALRRKPDQADMLRGISASFDASRRENLAPILRWLRRE